MSKIVIDNQSRLSDHEAILLVERHMHYGLISMHRGNPAYCLLTRAEEWKASVSARGTKSGHRFVVLDITQDHNGTK